MREKEILLVEDDDDAILLARRALDKARIINELVVAKDGSEAIEYLFGNHSKPSEQNNVSPALILLDLDLPKINGLDVLKRIRSDDSTCTCPVVIFTSSEKETDVIAGYKLGANSFIRKPVDSDKFSEAVKQVGLYWLVLNEAPSTK